MANLFWVGGTGTYDGVTNHFATTSGGAASVAAPTSADTVTFDTLSNATAYTVTISATLTCGTLVIGGPLSGNLTFAGSSAMALWGDFTIAASGITRTYTGTITFSATSGTQIFTSNAVTLASNIAIGGNGGTVQLGSNFTTGSSNTLSMVAGSTLTCPSGFTFSAGTFSANVACTLTLGTGTHSITGVSTCWTLGTTATLTATTSTIKFTNTTNSSVTVTCGGKTYGTIWFSRGASTGSVAIIGGNNTFVEIKDSGTAAHSLLFGSGLTQTAAAFTFTGTVGNVLTINTQSGTGIHSLTYTGTGKLSFDYLNVQHSSVKPRNTWFAGANSTNNQAVATAGNGWIFTVPTTRTKINMGLTSSDNSDPYELDGVDTWWGIL